MRPLTYSAFIFEDRWPFTANHRGTVYFEAPDLSASQHWGSGLPQPGRSHR